MTYSMPIRNSVYSKSPSRGTGQRKSWWANFTKTTREEKFGPGLGFGQDNWLKHREEVLATYNAKYDGMYVHFDSEQDATLFLLRWA